MKKIFSLMLCVMMFTSAFAQSESEHFTFKGVPIDGSLNSFVEKMKQKGYTYLTPMDDTALMKGAFAGYSDCSIYVISTKQNNLVYMVGVSFPESHSWSNLSSNYFSLKKMLTTKYGEPSDCTETFNAYSQPNDDQTKLLYAKTNRCKYRTIFTTSKGVISLTISCVKTDSSNYSYVQLSYFDYINSNINRSEAIDDL